ncbi:MAG: RNB domain-containing ribonuclease, partial [Panacagrimonas sp.]
LDALLPQLRQLDDLFKALFAARQQRGAIEFESSDTRILFDEERKISRIVPVQRNRAHQIIEECMIAANVAAAQRVARRKAPAPYRIHEQPDAQKVQALREFLAERGLVLGGGDSPSSDDFCKLMRRTAKRPDRQVLHTVILRSMMQARYSAENLGHFGLALEHYGHFTSPIRRYPDLLLHRTIKQLIRKQKRAAFIYEHSQIEQAAAHCSMTGRRADEAVRDVTTWLKCEYMHHRVGQAYDGVISGIAAFGLFVQLDGLFLDGLVHVSQLKNDYYQYEARHHRLIGDNSGRTYNLGERLRVRVVRVDLDERKIDLEIVDEPKGASKGSSRIKRSGSRWKRSNKFS